jgi:hypothetical protein
MSKLKNTALQVANLLRTNVPGSIEELWSYGEFSTDQKKNFDDIVKNWKTIEPVILENNAKSQLYEASVDIRVAEKDAFSDALQKYYNGGSQDIFDSGKRLIFFENQKKMTELVRRVIDYELAADLEIIRTEKNIKKRNKAVADFYKAHEAQYKEEIIKDRDKWKDIEMRFAQVIVYNKACKNTVTAIINNNINPDSPYLPGLSKENRKILMPDDTTVSVKVENGKPFTFFVKLTDTAEFISALEQITPRLESGVAIMVGVDSKKAREGENPGSATDHFIALVGQGKDPDGAVYFRYYDVGNSTIKNITSLNNKLYIGRGNDKEAGVSAISTIHKKQYTISEVRLGEKK